MFSDEVPHAARRKTFLIIIFFEINFSEMNIVLIDKIYRLYRKWITCSALQQSYIGHHTIYLANFGCFHQR